MNVKMRVWFTSCTCLEQNTPYMCNPINKTQKLHEYNMGATKCIARGKIVTLVLGLAKILPQVSSFRLGTSVSYLCTRFKITLRDILNNKVYESDIGRNYVTTATTNHSQGRRRTAIALYNPRPFPLWVRMLHCFDYPLSVTLSDSQSSPLSHPLLWLSWNYN